MSILKGIISLGGSSQPLTSRFAKFRHIYGNDVKITSDDKGWVIVDLTTLVFGEKPLVQDNTYLARQRKYPCS